MKILTQQQKKAKLRKLADKKLQEVIRIKNDKCEVCGGELSCGHHYHPKSTCSGLRYDIQNIIPICGSCHFHHHKGNPDIHNYINKLRGEEWIEELKLKKKVVKISESLTYYKDIIEKLNRFL